MHDDDHSRFRQKRQKSDQGSVSQRSGVPGVGNPGERTLTMSLQRERAEETDAWTNVVMRPDFYEASVQYAPVGASERPT